MGMLFQRRPPTESVYAVNELILDQAPGGTLFRSKNSPRDTDSSESGLGKIVSERDAASVTSRDGESGEKPGTCFYPHSFYLKRRLLVKTQTKAVAAISAAEWAKRRSHWDISAMRGAGLVP